LEHELLLHQVSTGTLARGAQANVSAKTQLILLTVSHVQDWCRSVADVTDFIGSVTEWCHADVAPTLCMSHALL